MDKSKILGREYTPYIHRMGKITNAIGLFLSFTPVIYLGARYGLWPQMAAVVQGFLSIAAVIGISWVMQPIQFFPILGVAGTYMSNISGNISNMRVPCSIAAEQAAQVDPGTPEAEICANIGSAVSTFINLAILTIGVIGGASLISNLSAEANAALGYLLPSLMGACVVMIGWGEAKILPLGIGIALLYRILIPLLLPALASFIDILAIFTTIAVCVMLYRSKKYLTDK